jgi:hypothetical protein
MSVGTSGSGVCCASPVPEAIINMAMAVAVRTKVLLLKIAAAD